VVVWVLSPPNLHNRRANALPNANLRYQVALDRRKMDKRRKPVPVLSAPFARAVMPVVYGLGSRLSVSVLVSYSRT
jgi:hypothetical protein